MPLGNRMHPTSSETVPCGHHGPGVAVVSSFRCCSSSSFAKSANSRIGTSQGSGLQCASVFGFESAFIATCVLHMPSGTETPPLVRHASVTSFVPPPQLTVHSVKWPGGLSWYVFPVNCSSRFMYRALLPPASDSSSVPAMYRQSGLSSLVVENAIQWSLFEHAAAAGAKVPYLPHSVVDAADVLRLFSSNLMYAVTRWCASRVTFSA